MISLSPGLDQSKLEYALSIDKVVQRYREFFSGLDWSAVSRWEEQQSSRGRPAHPESAYIKAFLIRINEGFIYTTKLRAYLAEHPLLVAEIGFNLEPDPTDPLGFDVEKTLPCRFWLSKKLEQLDRTLLQDLLNATVSDLKEEIPGLGETVAFDVKHIYAWVQENNDRAYVKDRYDKTRQLKGDPDCKLGVKRSTNQEQSDGSTKEEKEYIWGYGSGVAAATTPDYGDVVLAEYTKTFNAGDVTYFQPLYQHSVIALDKYPTNITADAAYDAWYVYEAAVRHGGIGAVPLNSHSKTIRASDGTPYCDKGLLMHPTKQFNHTNGYRAQRFQCPFLFPEKTCETCDHEQFVKGKGCVKDMNWEQGGIHRVTLDRKSPLYHVIYTQRTSCERINSQAKELGIERPKVRNGRSVANLNTLIYLVINVRALQRAKALNAALLSNPKGILQML
jgi:hypothetical protein